MLLPSANARATEIKQMAGGRTAGKAITPAEESGASDMGRVVGLFVSPGIGQSMKACAEVRALAGRGLDGDRYATGQGSYSQAKRQVIRHVSIIEREAIEAANEELARRGLVPFEPNETRRNIVVEGADVCALLGREFSIGDVRLRHRTHPTLPYSLGSGQKDRVQRGVQQPRRSTSRNIVRRHHLSRRRDLGR